MRRQRDDDEDDDPAMPAENSPGPRIVLPALRAWELKWYDQGEKKNQVEIHIGHQLAFPQPNMIVVMEHVLMYGEVKSMARKVVIAPTCAVTECAIPVVGGSTEVH